MSTPDMADVARLVNADTPPAVDTERLRLIDAMERAASDLDSDGSVTYRGIVTAALAAAEAYPGYALVRLPEPTEGEDGDRFWHIGRRPDHTVLAAVDRDGTPRVEACDPENLLEMRPDSARLLAARLLAAADVAERLADEHNTAAQDAEEGDQHG